MTIDLSQFSGQVSGVWRDPTDGTETPIAGSPFAPSGARDLTVPSANASGAADWVLVLHTG